MSIYTPYFLFITGMEKEAMGEYTKTESIGKGSLSWNRPKESRLNWNLFDQVLELLKDSQWHSLNEIEEKISLPKEEFAPVLKLFIELGFISRMDEGSKVRIKPLGVEFLELPHE